MDERSGILLLLLVAAMMTLMPIQGAEKGQKLEITPLVDFGTFYFYFADPLSGSPGKVFESTNNGDESVYFSRATGSLERFVFNPANEEELYYIDTYSPRIFKSVKMPTGWSLEGDFFTHKVRIRDLAFKSVNGVPRLFFSEADGATGKIYWIDSSGNAVLYYEVNRTEVPVNEVGKDAVESWRGDFTFDDAGVLYLSSGNQVPASIFRVEHNPLAPGLKPPEKFGTMLKLTPLVIGQNQNISTIYTDYSGGISGIAYRGGSIYYVRGQEISRLDLSTMKKSNYLSLPGHDGLSDLGF